MLIMYYIMNCKRVCKIESFPFKFFVDIFQDHTSWQQPDY